MLAIFCHLSLFANSFLSYLQEIGCCYFDLNLNVVYLTRIQPLLDISVPRHYLTHICLNELSNIKHADIVWIWKLKSDTFAAYMSKPYSHLYHVPHIFFI